MLPIRIEMVLSNELIKNQTSLTCKVKFDDNSIDLMKAEDDNNERMLAL